MFPSVPKKTAIPKIFIEHLKKKVFINHSSTKPRKPHENRTTNGRNTDKKRTKIALKSYSLE